MLFHRVSYRLGQSNDTQKHDRSGQLLVSVVWRKRQSERQKRERGDEAPLFLNLTKRLQLDKHRDV